MVALPRHDFFVPVRALSILFRAKFRDALGPRLACCRRSIRRCGGGIGWCNLEAAVGDGRASFKYLAPYVFCVAISDRRIVSYKARAKSRSPLSQEAVPTAGGG